MDKFIQSTRRITFEEVVNLVACPFCRANKGENCLHKTEKLQNLNYPHPSRGYLAFETKDKSAKDKSAKDKSSEPAESRQ